MIKVVEFLSTRVNQDSIRDMGPLSKGQSTKLRSESLILGFGRGKAEQSRLEPHEELLVLVTQGRELKGQAPGSLH